MSQWVNQRLDQLGSKIQNVATTARSQLWRVVATFWMNILDQTQIRKSIYCVDVSSGRFRYNFAICLCFPFQTDLTNPEA